MTFRLPRLSLSSLLGALLLALSLAPGPSVAQDMALPADVQYPLLLRILSFDRTLESSGRSEVVIGIVYQPRYRTSLLAHDGFLAAARSGSVQTVNGKPVRLVSLAYTSTEDLLQQAAAQHCAALYVTPLRAVALAEVAQRSQRARLMTITGVPAYVNDGLVAGIGLRSNRPEILINREAARASGVQFNARLLAAATIVED